SRIGQRAPQEADWGTGGLGDWGTRPVPFTPSPTLPVTRSRQRAPEARDDVRSAGPRRDRARHRPRHYGLPAPAAPSLRAGSAFTLYGIVFLFGKSGSVKIAALAQADLARDPLVLLALLLLLVGFGFKMSLAPFHGWAPDVYQGMPTPAVAYLSVAPKAASL